MIEWKWDGRTVTLSGGPSAPAPPAAPAPSQPAALTRHEAEQPALVQMQRASPAQKREWSYYMRHALRDLKKGGDAEDWLLGLINSGGLNVEEDGYTWWKGLSEKDAHLVNHATDQFMNRIGVWYRDETGAEQFNPDALRTYQEEQNRLFIEESQRR